VEFPLWITFVRPKTTKLVSYYWGGQSHCTHPYTALRAHSHRQHSPTRATTQEFLVFIRHPEPQLKGYVPSHIKVSTNHIYCSNIAWHHSRGAWRCQLPDRLAGDAYRQAPCASETQTLQISPGKTTFTARRTHSKGPLFWQLSLGGSSPTAKRCTSTLLSVGFFCISFPYSPQLCNCPSP